MLLIACVNFSEISLLFVVVGNVVDCIAFVNAVVKLCRIVL